MPINEIRSLDYATRMALRIQQLKSYEARVDGCLVLNAPPNCFRVRNALGEEILSWDSFVHLWLRNIECDQPFVTKPHLLRRR